MNHVHCSPAGYPRPVTAPNPQNYITHGPFPYVIPQETKGRLFKGVGGLGGALARRGPRSLALLFFSATHEMKFYIRLALRLSSALDGCIFNEHGEI